jgi:predicted lipid-binding transport protein (Tim44 family)
VTSDSAGTIIDGDPDQPLEVVDIWTFARNTRSRNPNWTLIETRVPS